MGTWQSTKKKIHRVQLSILAALVTILFLPGIGRAQVTTGTITGTVKDPSGAVVPGAQVRIQNLATGIAVSTVTNGFGIYSVPALAIGGYQVQIQRPGFKTVIRSPITLTVGRVAVVDVSLQVGATTQQVRVVGNAPLIDTANSTVSTVINSVQVRQLPLNGRDLQQLILLTPGVSQVNATGSPGTYTHGNASTFSVAGLRPVGMTELLDGADVSNFYREGAGNLTGNTSLGVDSIAEFQALTNTYSAEFGGQGAVINESTRAGTNQVHGSAYGFYRDQIFDAKNYQFPGPANVQPGFHKGQAGADIGGPIRKNRTFFFGNFEMLRASLALTSPGITLDSNARNGYVPCPLAPTLPCTNGLADVGVSPNIAGVLPYYPLATGAELAGTGLAQFTGSATTTQDENYGMARIDEHLSARDSMFGSYVIDHATTFAATVPVPGYGSDELGSNQYFTLQENHIISPTLLNVADFHFVREKQVINPETLGSQEPALNMFGDNYATAEIVGTFGVSGVGGGTIDYITKNEFQFSDHVFATLGRHSLQAGLDVNRIQGTIVEPLLAGGIAVFTSLPSLLQASPLEVLGPIPVDGNSEMGLRETQIIPFIQDNFKVNSNLTMNLGLRYGYVTNPTEVKNNLWNMIDPLSPTGVFVRVPHAFASNPSLKNWDPRFGFAYTPSSSLHTSIRGGFGIFHNLMYPRDIIGYSFGGHPYNFTTLNIYIPGVTGQPIPFPKINPVPPGLPASDLLPLYSNTHTAYAQEWNLNVQRQLSRDDAMTIAYVGSASVHLPISTDLNYSEPTGTLDGRLYRAVGAAAINPNAGSLLYEYWEGNSHYNAMQASFQHRAEGFQLLTSYTFGNCIDYMSEPYTGDSLGQQALTIFDPLDPEDNRGLCDFSVRQNFNASAVYKLPFAQNSVFGGFQLGLISTVHSGLPFTPLEPGGQSNVTSKSTASSPPDRVSGVSPAPGLRRNATGLFWLNTAAFQPSPFGVVGSSGRDSVIAPGYTDFDFALIKNTPIRIISESSNLQFRWEVFNMFNHPNFGMPNSTIFGGSAGSVDPVPLVTAGQITGTIGVMRQMQFGLKLTF